MNILSSFGIPVSCLRQPNNKKVSLNTSMFQNGTQSSVCFSLDFARNYVNFNGTNKIGKPRSKDTYLYNAGRSEHVKSIGHPGESYAQTLNRLGEEYHNTGSEKAKEDLLLWAANKIGKGVKRISTDPTFKREDAIQNGYVALLENLNKYDPARGSFSAFSDRILRSALTDFVRNDQDLKGLGYANYVYGKKIDTARENLRSRTGIEPSLREIATEANCGTDVVLGVINGRSTSLEGLRPSTKSRLTSQEIPESFIDKDLFVQGFKDFYQGLSEFEQSVLKSKYKLVGSEKEGIRYYKNHRTDKISKEKLPSSKEIGEQLGCSEKGVNNALERIKHRKAPELVQYCSEQNISNPFQYADLLMNAIVEIENPK